MEMHIRAGHASEIDKRNGEWLFIDLGFGEKAISCGVLKGDCQPTMVSFGKLVKLAKWEAQQNAPSPLNLVLEAPLSVTFNKDGNPTPRACDWKNEERRDWYRYAAPSMILAAGYLLQALANCGIQRDVRLYEGFVSFKTSGSKTDHIKDVKALKDVVWNHKKDLTFTPAQLKRCESDHLKSAFGFMGMDFGIPPVIRP